MEHYVTLIVWENRFREQIGRTVGYESLSCWYRSWTDERSLY